MDQTRTSDEGNLDAAERRLCQMQQAQQDAPPSNQVIPNLILQERKCSVLSTISEKENEGDHSSCERESLENRGGPTNISLTTETKLGGSTDGDHKVTGKESCEVEQSSSEEESFENQGEPKNPTVTEYTLGGMTCEEAIDVANNAQVNRCIEAFDAMDSSAREADGQTATTEDNVGTGDADNLTIQDKSAAGIVSEPHGNGEQGPACEKPEQCWEKAEQCCENPELCCENPEECCEFCDDVQVPEGKDEAEEENNSLLKCIHYVSSFFNSYCAIL